MAGTGPDRYFPANDTTPALLSDSRNFRQTTLMASVFPDRTRFGSKFSVGSTG